MTEIAKGGMMLPTSELFSFYEGQHCRLNIPYHAGGQISFREIEVTATTAGQTGFAYCPAPPGPSLFPEEAWLIFDELGQIITFGSYPADERTARFVIIHLVGEYADTRGLWGCGERVSAVIERIRRGTMHHPDLHCKWILAKP